MIIAINYNLRAELRHLPIDFIHAVTMITGVCANFIKKISNYKKPLLFQMATLADVNGGTNSVTKENGVTNGTNKNGSSNGVHEEMQYLDLIRKIIDTGFYFLLVNKYHIHIISCNQLPLMSFTTICSEHMGSRKTLK